MAGSTLSRRWLVWLTLLAGAAGLAVFGDKTPPGAARSLSPASSAARGLPPPAPRPRTTAPAAVPIEQLLPRAALAAAPPPRGDLFATPAWRQPPPPAMPVRAEAMQAPLVAPPPPPLPYRSIGKKLEGPVWQIFLVRDDIPYVVSVGDTLESVWRVERIAPPQAALRHLPSGHEISLDIGPAP
jgi:hypothetical protein